MPGLRARWSPRIHLGLVALLLALVGLVGAPAATAAPFDCKSPPAPEYPGAGLVGQIDPAPLGVGVSGSAYAKYGYAGMVWHTYGVSGPCSLAHPMASADTWIGNQLFNVGKTIVAATNALHYAMQDKGMLDSIDQVVNRMTITLYDGVFRAYVAVALLLAAVMILAWMIKGELAKTGRKLLWIVVGLGFASATYLTPLVYTSLADEVLLGQASQLHSNILSKLGYADPRDGVPTLLHKQVVYKTWLAGEFGDAEAPTAKRYGMKLLDAQACSKRQVLQGTCDAKAKQEQFTQIAKKLEQTPAYATFRGIGANRTGIGVFGLLKALCFASFQLMCKAGVLVAQLVIRMVIMLGPVFGLLAVVHSEVLPKVFRSVGNVLGQGLLLALAGAVHVYLLTLVMRSTNLPIFSQLFIIGIVTMIGWVALRPWWRLNQMLASSIGAALPNMAQQRMMRSVRRQSRAMRTSDRIDRLVSKLGRSDEPKSSESSGEQREARARPETRTEAAAPRQAPGAATEQTVNPSSSGDQAARAETSAARPEDVPVSVVSTEQPYRPSAASEPESGAVELYRPGRDQRPEGSE